MQNKDVFKNLWHHQSILSLSLVYIIIIMEEQVINSGIFNPEYNILSKIEGKVFKVESRESQVSKSCHV